MKDLLALYELADFLIPFLSGFRWFRRWCGGHWERWYLDNFHADVWFRKPCGGERPHPLARGTPTCEDWPVKR